MPDTQSQKSYETIRSHIENIANNLCKFIDGNFNFYLFQKTDDELIQKLSMLINFLLDTARRTVEMQKKQNEELKELDKMKSNFMANISHELRTPLTLILTPLEEILSKSNNTITNDQHDELERMYRNTLKLHTLVNDLLDFSKAEAKKIEVNFKKINIPKFIELLLADMQPFSEHNKITLSFKSKFDD